MKYLQTISPFHLISALATRPNPPQPPSLPEPEQDSVCSYQDAEAFVVGLRRACAEMLEQASAARQRIVLFDRLEVEPHYLESTSPLKMLEFEFQLGEHAFPERTEVLHQQASEVARAMREVARRGGEIVQQYFCDFEAGCRRVDELLQQMGRLRRALAALRERQELLIRRLLVRKGRIKEKLQLLRKVKAKNEAAFLEISNIDQAFATEQSRVKLYRKLSKLTELDRSKYIATIRNRLVATSRANKTLVETGLRAWTAGELDDKQVEKLVFMVYFVEKEDVYRDHQIRLDYNQVDRARLRQEIGKIFQWKGFHYMREASSRERIHEFLHFLLARIE